MQIGPLKIGSMATTSVPFAKLKLANLPCEEVKEDKMDIRTLHRPRKRDWDSIVALRRLAMNSSLPLVIKESAELRARDEPHGAVGPEAASV